MKKTTTKKSKDKVLDHKKDNVQVAITKLVKKLTGSDAYMVSIQKGKNGDGAHQIIHNAEGQWAMAAAESLVAQVKKSALGHVGGMLSELLGAISKK